jgi:hypothetical protein
MVAVPWPTAVATPVAAPMVAIAVLLELHATWLVRFTVAPDEVDPTARNWAVCVGAGTVCEPGITEIETIVPPAWPPLEPDTVTVALALTGPLYPPALAVIVVLPEPTAVASPDAVTVATEGALEVQVTPDVMLCVERWVALP